MAMNTPRGKGQPKEYKFDRGGTPNDFGPFIGIVMNNIDNTRQGRLQVYIEQFAGPDRENQNLWRTVSYCPPFYGATQQSGTTQGTGTFVGNRQSYGFWATPPDLGVSVLCFFVGGDPSQGYYVGCIPDQGLNQMIPAVGAVTNYVVQNANQSTYFAKSPRLPVTEINAAPSNTAISESPQPFNQPKPVHSYSAAVLFQQGLNNDTIRGPIASSSQRESPSNCYGMSTPGRAIYQGGATDATILQQADSASTNVNAVNVVGRRGGHTFVMDDGAVDGSDNLIRIRTSKGHQITMSDDGNCLYICHANGQAWVELGQEGTLDVYTTNSINMRTEGTLNFHSDGDINMFAGGKFNVKSKQAMNLQSDEELQIACKKNLTLFSQEEIGVSASGMLAIKSKLATIDGGAALSLKGLLVSLNGGPGLPVTTPKGLTNYIMPNTEFNNTTGWQVSPTGTESICTRAPTHEPWPYHNQGVGVTTDLSQGQTTPSPGAPAMPSGFSITSLGSTAIGLVSEAASTAGGLF